MKRYLKTLFPILIFALLILILFPTKFVYAGTCGASTCGCGARGYSRCGAGMTCWYTDTDGCSGHSWYFYESVSATCTSGGRTVYKCSICPGQRIYTTPPLGHSFSGWSCVNSSQHRRSCSRCGYTQYEGHSLSGWNSQGNGYYRRHCYSCSFSQTKGIFISASVSGWTADEVTLSIKGYDGGNGNSNIRLYRVNCITGVTTLVGDYSHGGTGGWTYDKFTQSDEGIYYFYAISTDTSGHSIKATTSKIFIDKTDPVINGLENTETDWTNIAPVISVNSTDYLYETSTVGSGLKSLTIYDDKGLIATKGEDTATYTLKENDEGEHVWKIEAIDKVGHVSEAYVTTRYDITPPGIDGTEITYVTEDGELISGYCQDNIISQHIDDEIERSEHNANKSSGIKSVILYKVTGTDEEVIYSDTTNCRLEYPDTHSYFDVYYDINLTDDKVDYYILITEDFAGNRTKKKLTSQRMLLTLFHTSIDRGAY